MPMPTQADVIDRVLAYLKNTYSESENSSGWGLRQGSPVSITNTAEALLTYKILDCLSSSFLADHTSRIQGYLQDRLKQSISANNPRTRDLALGVTGLCILEERNGISKALDRLSRIGSGSGWPESADETEPSLVATFQAIRAFELAGEVIDESHLDWLVKLQAPSNQFRFSPSDLESSFGASCLALFLLASSRYRDKMLTYKLAEDVLEKLPLALSGLVNSDSSWVSHDSHSNFMILGYGHGLYGAQKLGLDIYKLDLSPFLVAASDTGPSSEFLAMDPRRTWVPAGLELALAVAALRDGFDPIRYATGPSALSRTTDLAVESERLKLQEEGKRIALQQAVIDELEKKVLRQSLEVASTVDTALSNLPATLMKLLAEDRLIRRRKFWRKISLGSLIIVPVILLIYRWKQGLLNFSDIYSYILMVIPLAIMFIIGYIQISQRSRGP